MSMSDCEKCWSTPCECGYGYTHYNVELFAKFIANILTYKTDKEKQQILKQVQELIKK